MHPYAIEPLRHYHGRKAEITMFIFWLRPISFSDFLFRSLSPDNNRVSGERGRRPWPGRTRTEGTGAGFAQAKAVTAEARPFDSLVMRLLFTIYIGRYFLSTFQGRSRVHHKEISRSDLGLHGSCQSIKQCWHCFARAVLRALPQNGHGAVVPKTSGRPEWFTHGFAQAIGQFVDAINSRIAMIFWLFTIKL